MPATVYYADMHSRSHEDSKIAKVARLCDAVGLKKVIKKNDLTAIKLHFGEYGNDTHLNPTLVRQVVDKVLDAGGKPFLTDTTTLYSGSRHNAVDHLQTAYLHGFAPSVVRAVYCGRRSVRRKRRARAHQGQALQGSPHRHGNPPRARHGGAVALQGARDGRFRRGHQKPGHGRRLGARQKGPARHPRACG